MKLVSSIFEYSFPAQGVTPTEGFDNYLLQNITMDNSTLEQTDISVDTLINENINYQSVTGIDFNTIINSRTLSTKGISSASVTTTDEGRLKRHFLFGNCF